MSSVNGYSFYFDDGSTLITLPITPGELKITVGSRNETVDLINEGEVNILKSPSLTEVEFEARFPMRKYPYSKTHANFQSYYDFFKALKEGKKSFRFIVTRTTPSGKRTWDTNLQMSLEEMTFNEDADEGDDVLINFTLKQYKSYGVKTITVGQSTRKTVSRDTGSRGASSSTYTVEYGDCLYNIAKAAYGDSSKWKAIYEANKSLIESTAKNRGMQSSSNGHWIFSGTELTIPGIDDADLTVKKLSYASSSSSSKKSRGKTSTVGGGKNLNQYK